MLPQAIDLREEGRELHRLLETLDEADWARPTLFKSWTPNDILQHLHMGDVMAAISATDPAAFAALRADIAARRATGISRVAETRERLGNPRGRRLLDLWHGRLESLCDLLGDRDPDERLAWAGPDMGVRMFTTARQMECWAHGQAIYDLMDRDRVATERLRNIAVIGVRTFGWTFANRGLPAPGPPPHVRLLAPSGDTWTWNPPQPDNEVAGQALAFCQVVAQVRNVADTDLRVVGEPARQWMAIAQCFAGPPEEPPAPGSRHRATVDKPARRGDPG